MANLHGWRNVHIRSRGACVDECDQWAASVLHGPISVPDPGMMLSHPGGKRQRVRRAAVSKEAQNVEPPMLAPAWPSIRQGFMPISRATDRGKGDENGSLVRGWSAERRVRRCGP